MMESLKKAAERAIFSKHIGRFKKEISAFYNTDVALIDMSGSGATFTFKAASAEGKNLCVAKLKNPRKERISKRVR